MQMGQHCVIDLGRIEAGGAQFGPDRARAISRETNAKRTIKLAQPLSAAREVWMQTPELGT